MGSLAQEPMFLTTTNNSQYLHSIYNEPDILLKALQVLTHSNFITNPGGKHRSRLYFIDKEAEARRSESNLPWPCGQEVAEQASKPCRSFCWEYCSRLLLHSGDERKRGRQLSLGLGTMSFFYFYCPKTM